MSKDKNLVIIKKEKFFDKILKFFKGIFLKKNMEENLTTSNVDRNEIVEHKNEFLKEISVKEDKEEIGLIEKVEKNINLLNNMSLEELNQLNEVLNHQQSILDNKVKQLKNEIAITQFKLKKIDNTKKI